MLKILKRILLGLLVVIGLLIALLVGVVVVDGLMGGGRLEAVTNTTISSANGPEIRAFVARPSTVGPHPTVIMIHEFWGLTADITGKAEALAQEGYLVVSPDLFRGSTAAWVPRAIWQVISTPQEQIIADLDAVYEWLSIQPDVDPARIAIMGFCFGGGASLRYSLHNNELAATVILYGSPVTEPAQLKSLPGPVLGIFGGADASIPIETVNAFEAGLTEAGGPNQISVYEGQPHAFVRGMEAIRQGGPQAEAWNEVLTFLNDTLKESPPSFRRTDPSNARIGWDWGYWIRLAYEHTVGGAAHGH